MTFPHTKYGYDNRGVTIVLTNEYVTVYRELKRG